MLVVSERTRRDVERHYGVSPAKVTVTPNGVDPHFSPGGAPGDYVLFVGAIQRRKDPLAALAAAHAVDLRLVVVGPEKEPALAAELRAGGADLRGYVDKDELADLYRGAVALVLPSRFEGFGLPVLEAMACGTPVVISDDPALREVAGDAAAASIREAIENRGPLSAGRDRTSEALLVGGDRAPHRRRLPKGLGGVRVSAVVVSHEGARELARVAAGAPASGRRAARDRERAGLGAAGHRGARERTAARLRGQPQPRHRPHERRRGARREPRRRARSPVRSPRCGTSCSSIRAAASPGRGWSTPTDGRSPRGAASRRSTGTIVRRTPLRKVLRQQRHYHLDEPEPSAPVQCDWMLGGFLLLRRTMLEELGGFDEGFRLYGEDIDLQYRAMRAGWERWYVPAAVVRHAHQAVTDRRFLTRRTLWHWRGILRFVRKHPERLRAL